MAEDTEVPIDVIEETIANGYSWSQAASDVAGNPFIFDDPVLGFRDFDEVTDITDPGDATYTTVGDEGDIPIMQSEVIDALPTDMDPEAQSLLAMEMFLNVDGAYGDIKDVFEEDGTVNQERFIHAVDTTLKMAANAGPMGYGTTTKYLNILTSAGNKSLDELNQQFAEEKSKSGGTFPGLVLNRVVDTGFSNVLGRTATKQEQQDFASLVLELGDSIQGVEHLGLQAEEFARTENVQEAEAMDYKGAADGIMKVLGIA